MKLSLCIVAACIGAALSAPFDDVEPKQATPNYRLPTTVLPSNYNIVIEPFFNIAGDRAFTFDAIATITLRTTQTGINQIILHTNDLILNEPLTTLTQGNSPTTSISISTFSWDSVTHKQTLSLASPLIANVDYLLKFSYRGILSEDMRGFYRSSYVENGVTKWLGTTQMQPTHARRVFPCFDEPSFKATFDITITRPSTHEATISNTRRISSTPIQDGSQRTQDVFGRTPVMSTYLVAFIVSEFRLRSNTDQSFRVLARPDAYAQTAYAHDVGPKLLAQLDSYLAYPYASVPEMTKMEMAALPDFSAGAMENWGLLTYRETALLYDPQVSTSLAQQRVATVITHEQAHMWFGDLVTCDWWSYTWLNEGFARYFQYYGTLRLQETHWDLDLQFLVDQLQNVMLADSLETTHPMSHDVNTPSEISGIFDSISYAKGASVIRMMEHVMGSTNFQLALQQYLRVNQYKTTTPELLYASLQNFVTGSSIVVAEFLNTWTTQSGYPVITVKRDADRRSLEISQKRFLLKNASHTDNTRWELRLNFATSATDFQSTASVLSFPRTQASINHTLTSESDWVIFNVQQTGYYRVNYDSVTWQNIGTALKSANYSNIHVINRAQIIDDALNLARGDLLEYNIALNILQYLEDETNYLPWTAAFNNLLYVQRRFTLEQAEIYKKFILLLVDKIYNNLGFVAKTGDTRLDVYNRANILSYACKFGHEACKASATAQFDLLVASPTGHNIPPNVRPVVYCTAVTEGGESEWNFLWNRFLTENVAAEQVVLLAALGCTKNATTLQGYMNRILSNDVRLQDKSAAFTATYNNHEANVQTVLEYVIANYAAIRDSFGSITDVASILSNLAARFSTETQITQLENFYTSRQSEFGSSTTVSTAIADAKFNLGWAERHVPEIYNYMNGRSDSSRLVSFSLLLIISTVIVTLFN